MQQEKPLPNKPSTLRGSTRIRDLPDVYGVSTRPPETDTYRCCDRHPMEVAGSLQTRDMIPLAKGLVIWFLYNQHLSRSMIIEMFW